MTCFSAMKMTLMAAGLACSAMALTGGVAAANPFHPTVWQCYRNDAFTVIATDNGEDVGTQFHVRKTTPSIKADCAIEQRQSDYVIGKEDASYYLALTPAFLVLDDGTGPDRGLVIYHLPSRKRVLSEGYTVLDRGCNPADGCDAEDFIISEKGITFWREVTDQITPKACANYKKLMSETGSGAIEQKSFFNFATMKIEASKERRCVSRQ